MEWVIGLGIFVVGALVGFGLTKVLGNSNSENKQLTEQLEQHIAAQQNFKQDVDQYLQSVNNAMQSIAQQAQAAATESQQQFNKLTEVQKEHKEYIPYFSAEVSDLLQQNNESDKDRIKSHKTINDEKPLDYSADKMGLFESSNK
ncbi:ZapG family protein [Catenovulum maritimum]|uniref:Uncharacterized protein n=1 Tax=Catenovulum maritimum TaxID=1513271 RepID=A0A0J8GQI5_9ALTE|nr:DUF1043 family protein [Catenovulum maritimum]KMT65035.1 hypothetical protein XM47_11170 [Catenovulum maritimum]